VTQGAQGDMTLALCEQLHSAMLEHMKTISLRSLASEQKSKGFQVQARKPGKKSLIKQPAPTLSKPNAPNSVFALGSWLPKRA
jgi:Rrf2 family iron-sulfur cluster assembly transcriptional regulator